MTDEQIIREIHEAEFVYRKKFCEEIAKPEMATLPQDVREAKAALACVPEAERLREARVAAETVKAAREERWIAAHEYASAWRSGAKT